MQAVPTGVGPRRLLGRIRDLMAGEATAQAKLDKVVQVIAAGMVAEVCSVYILRAGEVLELFATKGLRRRAVHQTRLRVGEGLVGEIAAYAQPLALSDAQSHPAFVYRPETGEEVFRSLMGVPILRSGRVAGVLVVQNKIERTYSDEEIEAMQITAMVLAELVASGELVNPHERAPAEGIALLPVRLDGVALNGGMAMGTAVLHRPDISIRQVVAEDPELELRRLGEAVEAVHENLDRLFGRGELSGAGEHRDVLDAYRMVASDSGWIGRIGDAIRSGLTAEAGVQQVRENISMRMSQLTDPYLRERLDDMEDLSLRLLQRLTGGANGGAQRDLPDDVVVVARSVGPAELLDYDPARLRGLIMERGSATSHVSIVARALDIPVIGQVMDLFAKVDAGDTVIVDAENRQVFVRPVEDVQQGFVETLRLRSARKQVFAQLRDQPAVTLDGTEVSLNINAGLELDVPQVHSTGADGIGLFRTEIPFMVRATYPDVEAQTALYRAVLDQADGKPVVFRTLDVGGDKELPYFESEAGENPALGWRAIRIALDRPAMLRGQVRALVRAADGRSLSVMFPLIAEVAEYDRAREVLDMELAREKAKGGTLPKKLEVGVMVEVPSLLWQLPALVQRVDFLSVGSNDLLQFLFATDRGNPRMAERYDPLSPPALKVLQDVVRTADRAGRPLSLCGEMASRPLEAMALVGLGYRSLSLTAASIGPVKTMVRSLRLRSLREYMKTILDSPEHSLRDRLRAFALDHDFAI
ncbi:MAG: phosphoenolpyruvate--protein phosphotransferase [Alphaproteobacteria bacterium]|nr:phosphoenolpyruvate--protein phosphotransferase [Alphaproteobacteria bacterium]MCZ6610359.1 phosphoenolpyruvate--protein phosphotransferase [Alphaproteobacteria bacterium]